MKKIKITKKTILVILGCFLTFGFLLVVIIVKILIPFKPSFYSYSSYADYETIKQINKNYTYKEYGSVEEFEFAFENNKVIAGITSDYSIISLIIDGKVAPISKEIKEMNNLENEWESYFNESTIEQMNFYNQFLDENVQKRLNEIFPDYGQNYNFKFSDFVVPYFINDRLIAYDTTKIFGQKNLPINPLNEHFSNEEYPSLENALKLLKMEAKNKFKIQWTKNERENTVIGSTIDDPKNNWNTKIDDKNYNELLDNFANIVYNGTEAQMSNPNVNIFETDSDVVLNNVINPNSNISIALLYNGDALDAYYGSDNFEGIEDGDRLRIIRTKYTVRILDAFVVSSSLNTNEKEKLLKNFNDSLFNGMFLSCDDLIEKTQLGENVYELNGIMRIFDYVNYTPSAKGAYEFIYEDYFLLENDEIDEIARCIYIVPSTVENKIYVKGIEPIEKEVLSKLTLAFQRKLNGK